MKRKTDNFNKFYNKKNNAAIKEAFRQEKKAAKKERKHAIDRHFEERRKTRDTRDTRDTPEGNKGPADRRGSTAHPAHPAHPARPPRPANAAPPHHVHDRQPTPAPPTHGDLLPLNKYIAHAGICSRRDAAELVRHGKVTVNGKPVTEPGTKVVPSDTVKVNGKKITISSNFVYILLNKPKDYITTAEDPQGRRTVLDLIRHATTERVFPVGRLDRNTSGVLLLTNDGDLSQKLAHPSHEIKKIYHVVLDKPLTHGDFEKIAAGGIVLEDGPAYVDALAYADPKDRSQIGLEIHSGRNRIVRRIFEHLGYDVRGLDRVMYAGLTKKNVQRGKWRLLNEKEIRVLKYLNSSIRGSSARAKEWAAPTPTPSPAASPKSGPAASSKPSSPPAARSANPRPVTTKPSKSGPAASRPSNSNPRTTRSARSAKPGGPPTAPWVKRAAPHARPSKPNRPPKTHTPKPRRNPNSD